MSQIQERWQQHYAAVPETIRALQDIETVLSVFNTNIDAVRRITPALFEELVDQADASPGGGDGPHEIATPADLIRGFVACFRDGIAKEWLITDEATYRWLDRHVGYDRLQMGGQGGIIANVMATCRIQHVLVHAASLPAQQSGLFVDRENLLSADSAGRLRPVRTIDRAEDTPLIHWILEFRKGDTIQVGGEKVTCPKSNRFIATWDPLNFTLCLDQHFVAAVDAHERPLNYCMLSGYQMLTEHLSTGETSLDRIRASKQIVDRWRAQHDQLIVHFEYASTQDEAVRGQLFQEMSGWADSMGLNEQELIDVLEVTGQAGLAAACRRSLGAVNLFEGLRWVFQHCRIPRIQLHFFGLYVTLQAKGYRHTPAETRNGMAMAATVAAAKAGTGSIEKEENLLWAHGKPIGEVAERELLALAGHLAERDGATTLVETGIHEGEAFDVVAVPTIIVDQPVTLVGMGDTISSLSLVGAR
jgi:ADP-dependent phosphofructokinase/glucokinase